MPGQLEALYARLLDRGLSIEQIGGLTERQIHDLIGHKRDETGAVADTVDPTAGLSAKEADRLALKQGALLGIPVEELERLWSSKYPGEPFFEEEPGGT